MIISVEVTGTLAITQQMSKLDHLGKFYKDLILVLHCFILSVLPRNKARGRVYGV